MKSEIAGRIRRRVATVAGVLAGVLALLVSLTLLPVLPARAEEPTYAIIENTTTENRTTVLSVQDPINMATGEYHFVLDLLRPGGPLGLDYRLYYGTQAGKWYTDGLPLRFVGNHRATLKRIDSSNRAAVPDLLWIEPGLGAQTSFYNPAVEWRLSGREQVRYQLTETGDWYYLLDPERSQVRTFRKSAVALAGRVRERANLTPAGGQSAGDAATSRLAMSADGRYLAFESAAADLVGADTNGVRDVFVRERETGQTTRVSVGATGVEANGASTGPAISDDGRFVAFESVATNLVTGDTNGVQDVFLHDRQTGQTIRVSTGATGAQADGASSEPALSADGRSVAFASAATNLAAADPDATGDVFVYDRLTGGTTVESLSTGGTKGTGASSGPRLSADGRYLAWTSLAANLVAGDTNGVADCFVRDRQTGQTTRVSVDSAGAQADGACTAAAISADGRYVVFESAATNLVAGDANAVQDVFLHDRQTGQTTRVSVGAAGAEANGASRSPGISPDGRYVAFVSSATNLVTGDTNGRDDVFVHDRLTGETARFSRSPSGAQHFGTATDLVAIAGHARAVAFWSNGILTSGDTNGQADLLVAARVEPASAFLERVEDRNGNALTYENPADIATRGPTRVSDGLGRTLQLTYTTIGGYPYLAEVGDQAGRTVRFGYESSPSDNPGAVVLRSITDTLGNVRTFRYGGNHWVTEQILPRGNMPYTQTYNPAFPTRGVVQRQADAYGNTTVITASQLAEVNRFTAGYPDGTQQVFTHTHIAGVAQALVDPTGRTITFGPDPVRNQFNEVTDRLGATTTLTYHPASGDLAGITNARGGQLTWTFTPQVQGFTNPVSPTERVTFTFYVRSGVTYPNGSSEQRSYDERGNLVSRIDPAGFTWTYTYNGRGQVLTETTPRGGVRTYTYNSDGTLATSADSDTGATTYSYDTYKRLTRVTRPDGTTIQYAYDLLDRLTAVTDERGSTTTLEYDANGNLVRVTDALGQATRYTYDLMDRQVQATDRLGHTTSYGYDAMGRRTAITDASGVAIQLGYDARGWADRLTRGGQTWQIQYDAEGLPAAWTSPLAAAATATRDSLGFATAQTDPLGATTAITRDGLSRITARADPLGRRTSYAYDARGRITGVTVPAIGTATYHWDALGAFAGVVDPNGQTWTITRTAMGRIQAMRDPLGRVWQYVYDNRGRLSQATLPDGTVVTRTYDATGNLTRLLYSDGTDLRYAYDAQGRITGTTGLQLSLDAEGRVTRTTDGSVASGASYDPARRLEQVAYNNGAFTVTYTYSPTTGLLMRAGDSLTGARVDFRYDAAFRLVGLSRSNGVSASLTYDGASRLTQLQDGTFLDLQYTLDAAGEVTGEMRVAPLDPVAALAAGDDSFSFDPAAQVTATGYQYDGQARAVAAPGSSFVWDGASRLTAAAGVTLTYDGLGNVQTRTADGRTTRYHYNQAIGLTPVVAEQDVGTGQILRYYVWTPDGRLLYLVDAERGNAVQFYHFDRTGSTLALTDAAGTVTDAYAYDPYGRLLGRTGTSQQPFTFVGQGGVRQEGSSGTLYQMRARYYDAVTGRFLSRDPLLPPLGDPRQLNPYQYAAGDPIRRADVTGLQPDGGDSRVTDPEAAQTLSQVETFVFSTPRDQQIQQLNQMIDAVQTVDSARQQFNQLYDTLGGLIGQNQQANSQIMYTGQLPEAIRLQVNEISSDLGTTRWWLNSLTNNFNQLGSQVLQSMITPDQALQQMQSTLDTLQQEVQQQSALAQRLECLACAVGQTSTAQKYLPGSS